VSAAPALSQNRDCPVIDGHVGLPDAPGIGFKRKAEPYKIMKPLEG